MAKRMAQSSAADERGAKYLDILDFMNFDSEVRSSVNVPVSLLGESTKVPGSKGCST